MCDTLKTMMISVYLNPFVDIWRIINIMLRFYQMNLFCFLLIFTLSNCCLTYTFDWFCLEIKYKMRLCVLQINFLYISSWYWVSLIWQFNTTFCFVLTNKFYVVHIEWYFLYSHSWSDFIIICIFYISEALQIDWVFYDPTHFSDSFNILFERKAKQMNC